MVMVFFLLVMVWWLKNYMTQYYSMCICALTFKTPFIQFTCRWNVISCWLFSKINIMCMCHFLQFSPIVFASIVQSCTWHGVSHSIFKCFRQKWWSCESHALCSFMKWRVYCVAILLICTLFVNERTYFLDIV